MKSGIEENIRITSGLSINGCEGVAKDGMKKAEVGLFS